MRGRCSVITNSPPVKSRPGSRQQDRHLQRKHVLAVQVLVQAVVVAGAVLQQQRRRPRAGPAAWQRAMNSACAVGIAHVDAHRLVPAVGDRRQPRVERVAQLGDQRRAAGRRSTCTRRGRSRAAPSRRGCGTASSRGYSAASAPHSCRRQQALDAPRCPRASSSAPTRGQSIASTRSPVVAAAAATLASRAFMPAPRAPSSARLRSTPQR